MSKEIPRIPELEDQYTLVRELGRGGTSVVYLARDRELGRDVAVKLIRAPYARDDDAVARLVREARTVGRLQHPNIVMLLGTRRLGDGGLALILQFAPGRTLKERIRDDGPLPVPQAEWILRDVARALSYAHRQRIVHRDIKPENIYLDEEEGVARLADFGIARPWDSDSGLTLPGTAIGTPAYMSPEQVDGRSLDGRSDLYSLGLVGWEMLTGKQPWEGESLYMVIYRQKNEDLPRLAELRPDTPENLRRAIEGALAKDPEERWPDADAFLARLQEGSSLPPEEGGEGALTPIPGAVPSPGAAPPSPDAVPPSPGSVPERSPSSGPPDPRPAPAGPSPAPGADDGPAPSTGRRRGLMIAVAGLAAVLVAGGAFLAGAAGPTGLVRDYLRPLLATTIGPDGERPPDEADPADPGSGLEEADPAVAAGEDPPDTPGPGVGVDAPGPEAGLESRAGVDAEEGAWPPQGTRLSPLAGDDQEAEPGTALPEELEIRVDGPDGEPLPMVPVEFQVLDGEGRVTPTRALSDEDGRVRASWTLGPEPGVQRVGAGLAGREESVVVEARAGGASPAVLAAVSGADQEGAPGSSLSDPVVLRVEDAEGNPLADVEVELRVVSGGGSVDPEAARTGEDGTAEAHWTLGPQEGAQALEARVSDVDGAEVTVAGRAVPQGLPVRSGVVTGGLHTCRLGGAGELFCWGTNEQGQLGDGSESRRLGPSRPVQDHRFALVTSGVGHTCALDREGRPLCWGRNSRGQLGNETTVRRSLPAAVAGNLRLTALDAGAHHTCGLGGRGEAYCWGDNDHGQLGDGSRQRRTAPARVRGVSSFQTLAVGWNHSCGLHADGRAFCWGRNSSGELGLGETRDRIQPTQVPGGHRFRDLSAGNAHTCGVTPEGAIRCWGSNRAGQLGDGTTSDRDTPVSVEGDLRFQRVTAGGVHTCALSTEGRAYCWGRNNYGQLGDGTTEDRTAPVRAEGDLRFRSLHARGSHTCGETVAGEAFCWGYNVEGQLGDGSRENRSVPTPVR